MEYLLIILFLVLIEGLLSIDNALVLAILVRQLPDEKQRKRALLWGIWGAFVFRFIGLLLAAHLMRFAVFQLIGGGYLIYVTLKHFFEFYMHKFKGKDKAEEKKPTIASAAAFWKVVIVVELTDIAFSIDSIIAAVALSNKLWVIYTGAILGIITMRMVAGVFIKIIDRFPIFYHTGYILVGWVGIKLLLEYLHKHQGFPFELPKLLFWVVMTALFAVSFIVKADPPSKDDKEINKAQDDLEEYESNK